MNNKIITVNGSEVKPAYASSKEGQEDYINAINKATDKYNGIAKASYGNYTFQNLTPNISSRPEFTRDGYEYFRPNESIPRTYKEIIAACDNMYKGFTLVRNIIDLMSDFACQGITLVHPNKRHERFYNTWFKKVRGFDRSERFLNYLYRHAMVVIESRVGKIPLKQQKQFMAIAQDVKLEERDIESLEIPLQYIFHNPAFVERKDNTNPDKIQYEIVSGLIGVNGVVNFENSNIQRDLPIDKTFVYYFKKDDWEVKPLPFLFPLIQHAIMLNKLSLADSAALDGAMSAIRIFKLGDLEYNLAPTDVAVSKLSEILQSNVGGGTLDLIWGPDIQLIESKTDVHHFLGEAKYTPHLEQMYIGLGIPPTLAGRGGSGTTNNYISLKTLTKRLQYGRQLLIEFWQEQIKWVQKAMGFAKPAKIEFDFLDLGDEQMEKTLLIQLADRNLISDEKLQKVFGYDDMMERSRLNRENRERKSGRRVVKPHPFPDTPEVANKKIALQSGFLTPDQAGIKKMPGTEGQKTPHQEKMEIDKQKAAKMKENKGKQTRGRPANSKDKKKRTRTFRPQVKAALEIWAKDAQNKINDITKGEFLKLVGKSNFRQLNKNEAEEYEQVIFGVLNNIDPFSTIDKDVIIGALDSPMSKNNFDVYNKYISDVKTELSRDLTLEETRQIQLIVYSNTFEDEDG